MLISEIIKGLENHAFDERLRGLYGGENVEFQVERYLNAAMGFQKTFGAEYSGVSVYSAPGRAEIIGNHTDHQKGSVVAASVGLDIIGVSAKNNETVKIRTEGYEDIEILVGDIEKRPDEAGSSAALTRGILSGFTSAGLKTGGFRAYVNSTVPVGSGLSSSAAFESLIGTILNHEFNNSEAGPVKIAEISQTAEIDYFGKPCGLMDQAASSVGGLVYIDFSKTPEPDVRKLSLDLEEYGFCMCVVNTGGSHAGSGLIEEYASIPAEMSHIAEFFGKSVLSETDEGLFRRNISRLREKCPDRAILRAMHFYGENARAKSLATSVENGRFSEFLHLISESGHSSYCLLQNIYSHKTPEQGLALALALSAELLGAEGAFRVHGGGFAGTIIAFVPTGRYSEYRREMDSVFGEGACKRLRLRNEGACRVI